MSTKENTFSNSKAPTSIQHPIRYGDELQKWNSKMRKKPHMPIRNKRMIYWNFCYFFSLLLQKFKQI